MRWRLVPLVLAACGSSGIDRERAAKVFREVAVATAPGLSGLAADDAAGIWAVAERAERAYRITLDAQLVPSVETVVIAGVPAGFDLEGIAWLGGGHFAFGTEGREDGVATVLRAERTADAIGVTGTIRLPAERLGIALPNNHGAEGICGGADTLIAAIEGAGEVDGRRWAPVVRIAGDAIVRVHRVWLTTKTGKLSGLDCRIAADGTAQVIAIERHFAVTKVLTFTLPDHDGDITPTEVLDLGTILNSRLNLEGIAWTSDGRVVAVVDNQWKTITGPSELLVFTPGAIGSPALR